MRHWLWIFALGWPGTAWAERRIALVVGSNAGAPGRQDLRYAHNDAARMAQTLARVGRFAESDVHVLLDVSPRAVLSALDDAARTLEGVAGDSLLFFYFSGHADSEAMFVSGEPLPYSEVRGRMEAARTTVRIGVVDACRGGGFTQAKGFSTSQPFEIPQLLRSEGSAFLASSSGLENAHEASAIAGSFFTHHFSAGLLGAADTNSDGVVSLQESFDYARSRTIRDTAKLAPEPQHPSFDINLRGRQDLVLGEPASSPSSLSIQQQHGPLEVIHLQSGLVVLELQEGRRETKLALPPGRYLVRRYEDGDVRAAELDLRAGDNLRLAETDLRIVSSGLLAYKLAEPRVAPRMTLSSVRKGKAELQLGFGVRSEPSAYTLVSFRALAALGITDRLTWLVGTPAFAYRFGEPGRGKQELILRGGMTGWGIGFGRPFSGYVDVGLGLDARLWFRDSFSLLLGTDAHSRFVRGGPDVSTIGIETGVGLSLPGPSSRSLTNSGLRFSGRMTLMKTWKSFFSLNGGVGFEGNLLANGKLVGGGLQPETDRDLVLSVGSVQSLSYRMIPLMSFHVLPWMSVDLFAAMTLRMRSGQWGGSASAGVTFAF